MNETRFMHEPSKDSIFKVQLGCCYTKVIYNGPHKGVYSRIDRHDEENGVLICGICDPNRDLKEVSEDLYLQYFHQVRDNQH